MEVIWIASLRYIVIQYREINLEWQLQLSVVFKLKTQHILKTLFQSWYASNKLFYKEYSQENNCVGISYIKNNSNTGVLI